jgi:hypothetical protein
MLKQDWSWRTAHFILQVPRLTDYSPDVSYFAYHMCTQLNFEELVELSESGNSPQPHNSIEDDYIEGSTRIILWKVVERLIDSKTFDQLHLSTPFHVGYALHEDGQTTVLRILNWPNVIQALAQHQTSDHS